MIMPLHIRMADEFAWEQKGEQVNASRARIITRSCWLTPSVRHERLGRDPA